MKRVFILTLFVCFALAACEKPCEPGFKKSGLKCKMIPIRDGGSSEAGTDYESDAEMDASARRVQDSATATPLDGDIDKGPDGAGEGSGQEDASLPLEAGAGGRVIEDGGPAPAPGMTSSQIAAVRAAILAGTSPVTLGSMRIDGAIVTYIKPAFESHPVGKADGPGLFVQNADAGPALWLAVDPTSIVAGGARIGDVLDLRVEVGQVTNWLVLATDVTARLVGEGAKLPRSQVVSTLDLLPFEGSGIQIPNDYELESELVTCSGTIAGPFATSGSGFSAALVTTAGEPNSSEFLVLRAPNAWVAEKRLFKGCTFTITGVPLSRHNDKVQLSAWLGADAEVTCPALAVTSTYPAAGSKDLPIRTPIKIAFNQPVDAAALTTQVTAGSCTGTVQLSPDEFITCLPFSSGNATMDASGTTATMTPKDDLGLATGYAFRVLGGTVAANGTPLSLTYRTAFTTTSEGASCSVPVVISQVYGGGGNVGASLSNDFVELHNRGAAPVSISGWTIQQGTGSSWTVYRLPDVAVPGGGYYLVKLASGGPYGVPLDHFDVFGPLGLGVEIARVALTSTSDVLPSMLPSEHLQDLIAYGGISATEGAQAPRLSSTTAALRNASGCDDTDDNLSDFSVAAPAPRSSSTAPYVCGCSGTK